MSNNPFFNEEDQRWYWFDETGDLSQPFTNKEDAQVQLDQYCKWLSGEDQPNV